MKNIPLLLFIVLFSSCFFKSNETGIADDVDKSMLVHSSQSDFLITHEEIYHATSKSSGGGISTTTGYAEYRLSAYDLQTGERKARRVTGDRDEDIRILGFDGQLLWCYGGPKHPSLQALNPASLKTDISISDIEAKNPSLAGNWMQCKAYECDQYYAWDALERVVIVTDMKGYHYSLSPTDLKAKRIEKMPDELRIFESAHGKTAYYAEDRYLNMDGDQRLRLKSMGSKAVLSKDDFLNAEFLLESDPNNLAEIIRKHAEGIHLELKKLQAEEDSLKRLYPLDNLSYNHFKPGLYIVQSRIRDLDYHIRDLQSDSGDDGMFRMNDMSNRIMGSDSTHLLIMHTNNLSDTASLLISLLNYQGREFQSIWSCTVHGIYFDPFKGIKQNPMSDVFKSGSPDFDYEWFGMQGNVICGIRMLHAFAIDKRNGRLLWLHTL